MVTFDTSDARGGLDMISKDDLHSTSCTNSKKNTASSAYGSRSLTTIKNLFFWVEEHQEKTIAIYRII